MQDTLEERVLLKKVYDASRVGRRDIELEKEIINHNDPDLACLYAIHVIKGIWADGEELIGRCDIRTMLTRFPDKNGNLVTYYNRRDRSKDKTTNIGDPCHMVAGRTEGIVRSRTRVMEAYLRLTKKRLTSAEENTKKTIRRWDVKNCLGYSKLAYELTREIVDFDNGEVAIRIIQEIRAGTFSKNIITSYERDKLIEELEQRVTLHSFAEPAGKGSIKKYFTAKVARKREMLALLDGRDDTMTIAELKKILASEAT